MSGLYDKGREGFLDGSINWSTGDIRAILVDTADYVVNLATHATLADIPAAAREEISASLTGKTVTAGVADANDVTFSSATGDPTEAIVLYQHNGAETARLIAYIDGAGVTVTLNGGNVVVAWDNGANKIFKL